MRLAFVHGINHQGKSSDWVREEWLEALRRELSAADFAEIAACDIDTPFYGDLLFEATQSQTASGPEPVAMSVGAGSDAEQAFLLSALTETALAAGLTEEMIDAEIQTGEIQAMGPPHDRRIIAIAQALETVSPIQGRIMLRLLPQAFTYLRNKKTRSQVNAIVDEALAKRPSIVVAHSLGTVVSFDILRRPDRGAPFFMTLGSPLAIKAVQFALDRPFARPEAVGRWVNGLDPNDFVTLGRPLDENTFGPGIDRNIQPIDNGDEDPHDFREYLGNPDVWGELVQAIRRAKG